jgi:hypothetical protein
MIQSVEKAQQQLKAQGKFLRNLQYKNKQRDLELDMLKQCEMIKYGELKSGSARVDHQSVEEERVIIRKELQRIEGERKSLEWENKRIGERIESMLEEGHKKEEEKQRMMIDLGSMWKDEEIRKVLEAGRWASV